jgi:hypothetical protein
MAQISIAGDTSGSVSLVAPAVSGTTTLTLPTTSGTIVTTSGSQTIEFADGSASTPSITNSGDTNTGIFFPAADTIAFAEGGTEAMRLDSSGNVGIGTTSPSSKLDINGKVTVRADGSEGGQLDILNPDNSTIGLSIDVTSSDTGRIFQTRNTSSLQIGQLAGTGGIVTFFTAGSERMRITGGNVVIGTTAQIVDEKFGVDQTATNVPAIIAKAATTGSPAIKTIKATNVNNSTQYHLVFTYNNGNNGNGAIVGNGDSQAAFASFSDSRLKKNIEDLPSQLDKINALRPVEFDYIKSGDHQIGFIAQEVKEVYPDLVAEGEDTMLTVTGLGKTEARLIKAIQEQQTIIETLKADIAELKAKVK